MTTKLIDDDVQQVLIEHGYGTFRECVMDHSLGLCCDRCRHDRDVVKQELRLREQVVVEEHAEFRAYWHRECFTRMLERAKRGNVVTRDNFDCVPRKKRTTRNMGKNYLANWSVRRKQEYVAWRDE